MAPDSRKIVIIGGGIAGLCAAIYGQACGYQVELLEQSSAAGGLATSWRRGEYTFETCLHWLVGSNPRGTLHAQWQEVFDIDKLRFIQPEEYIRLEHEHGEALSICSNVDKMETQLIEAAPQDTDEIRRFASAIRRLADFPLLDVSETWPRKALAFLRMLPRLPLLGRWARMSGEEYGRRFKHPLLRRFFMEGTTGQMSAVAVIFMLAWMSRRNAGYPIGGSRAVISPIVERFLALGGRLRLGAKVETILVENDAAVGVQLAGGETIRADWVISAADGHETIYDLLGGKYKDDAIDTLYAKGETFPSYLQVSLGVAQDLLKEPGHLCLGLNAPLMIDPETLLDAISLRIFNFDPTFASRGKTAVTCFLPTYNFAYWVDLQRSDPVRYEAEKQRIAEAVIAILDRRMPGIRERIEVIDVSTPASVVHFTGNWKGSMEGWLLTPSTKFGARRQNLPGLRRFFMVGQWVQQGGGLPGGLMTGRAAIQSLCRQDGVPFLPRVSSRTPDKAEREPRNRVVQVRRFGGPEGLQVADAPLPTAARGEVRVRVLASGLEYTDVVIRRHLYPQTSARRLPFVLGYDVVGEIDQLGEGVSGFQLGDRVADMTVLGSNATYRTLRASDLTRVPAGVDAAEAAALILSWTTAYQLLHRAARVRRGQRVLVHGAAGAVGQALLVLGRIAGLELWGTARGEHAALIRELGAMPIDYQHEDFTRVLPGGFDVIFDGIGEDDYRRSFAALKRGGLVCAYGYTARVQPRRRLLSILMLLARVYLWRGLLSWLPGGKRIRVYSINAMRARHPAWFKEDLERLFGLLAARSIRPRIADRISFDEVAEAHRRLEEGGLEGKLVLYPDLPPRRNRVMPQREPRANSVEVARAT